MIVKKQLNTMGSLLDTSESPFGLTYELRGLLRELY